MTGGPLRAAPSRRRHQRASTGSDELIRANIREVIAIDPPGFGGGEPLAGEVTVATLTDAVGQFLEQENLRDAELATLGWGHWHNTQRLHGYLGDVPPAEFEQAFYAGQTSHNQLVGIT